MPGGHVEPSEAPHDALVREMEEELGVVVTLGAPFRSLVDLPGLPGVEFTIWRVTEWLGEIWNAAPEEHDEIGWFSSGELDSLAFPDKSYPTLLRDLTAGQ